MMILSVNSLSPSLFDYHCIVCLIHQTLSLPLLSLGTSKIFSSLFSFFFFSISSLSLIFFVFFQKFLTNKKLKHNKTMSMTLRYWVGSKAGMRKSKMYMKSWSSSDTKIGASSKVSQGYRNLEENRDTNLQTRVLQYDKYMLYGNMRSYENRKG